MKKGHGIGKPVGDPWIMPGLFLTRADGQILWRHRFEHAGDHPDFANLFVDEPTATEEGASR